MRTAVAYFTYDHGARVNSDSDPERGLQLARQFAAKFFDTADHRGRGEERLPTGDLKVRVDSEQCHYAVAYVLVCDATRFSDGAADRLEVPVEEKYDVVGQLVLGDPCEAAYVREQHGDIAFPPALSIGWSALGADTHSRREERRDCYIAARPQLAGQTYVGRSTDALKHGTFLRGGWRLER
jgi:hypothetical protein